jgi:hypothetical protein
MVRQTQRQAVFTIEGGDIFFFYRPRVHPPGAEPPPHSLGEIERTYLVLRPRDRTRYRLLVIGRKRLPDLKKHEREWAFVEIMSRGHVAIEHELRGGTYETKTRGERVEPAARPAGEGVYAVVRHQSHTHLAYALELPAHEGPVQKALQIRRQASYIVSIKNPEAPSPPEVGLAPKQEAKYPRKLEQLFHGRKFMPADPTELLDYPGAQLLLVGASTNVHAELGLDLHPERENEHTAEIFRDLHLAASQFKVEPLFKGKWA